MIQSNTGVSARPANVTLEGAPNFRDLGGLRTIDGRTVRQGVIFRSEGPAHFNRNDVATLTSLGIRTICDLRSEGERQAHPNEWCGQGPLLNIDIDIDLRVAGNEAWELLRANPSVEGVRAAMVFNYRALGRAMEAPFRTLVDHLIDRRAVPVLVHCTGGKDRTGVIIALLLHALGVPNDAIVEDYVLSTRFAGGPRFVPVIRRMFADLDIADPPPDAVQLIAGVEASYLDAAMEALLSESRTLDRFFEERIGLDASRRAVLQEMCLE
jgi:protein-tyrosine phosphatase